MSKRISNIQIVLTGEEWQSSMEYVKNRNAELHTADPRLTDSEAIEKIVIQYATIIGAVRS